MNSKRTNHRRKLYILVSFLVIWNFFFASSFVLRINPTIFWPIIIVIAVIYMCYIKRYLLRYELWWFAAILVLVCLSGLKGLNSAFDTAYFLIYFIAALLVSSICDIKTLINFVLIFCIIHLICVYLQVIEPDIYISNVLPLLPAYKRIEIVEQMNYNFSFYGFTVQTSLTALYLSIGAIMSSVKARYTRKRIVKCCMVILVFLFIIGIFFTMRRGSSFAILLILAFIYFDTKKNKLSKLIFLVTGICFLVFIGLDNIPGLDGVISKTVQLSTTETGFMNGRDSIWTQAISGFWNHPILGYGSGNGTIVTDGKNIDNAYILILIERGLAGFTIFFVFIFTTFAKTLKKRMNSKNINNDLSLYIQILFIIMSLVENYLGDPYIMLIYYIIVLSELEVSNNIKKKGGA